MESDVQKGLSGFALLNIHFDHSVFSKVYFCKMCFCKVYLFLALFISDLVCPTFPDKYCQLMWLKEGHINRHNYDAVQYSQMGSVIPDIAWFTEAIV